MALFKENISANGIITKYHNVGRVIAENNQLTCWVYSFANKEYRDNNCEPIDTHCYFFDITVQEEESIGIRKFCYCKLKELQEWLGSEDC